MLDQDTSVHASGAFELLRRREISSLSVSVEEYVHRDTGAQHFHFVSDHDENVFMVTFRTVPEDSTGVAHILEHTTLCGSEKFPVRDPFFLMIRRSLNTFMNAFTASDYTAYPFASENRKDFQNLLEIYLDAVFFPLLDPLDFAQEGHRLEFAEPANPKSKLELKGIVYNEMKGDQSSIQSLLYEQVKAALFPTSTYHHNSGGDPSEIPNLTYEQLKDFHKRHYHPSNAIFMTFGNIPAEHHQQQFQTLALSRFHDHSEEVAVRPEMAFSQTQYAEKPYPVSSDETDKQSHVVMAWKLGQNTDLEELMKCNLLSDVLLDTSASPLRMALENTDLAIAPSPLCGLEESNLEMSFFCGLEGVQRSDAGRVERLILDTLTQVAETGVEPEQIEACLHQLELSHREIGGDGYPYGLQLMFSCLSATVHRSDPIALLDLDEVLLNLRHQIQDPNFFPALIRTRLLANPHRVCLTLFPDETVEQRAQQALEEQLNMKKSSMTDQDKQQLIAQTEALETRQNREEPVHLLPKVGLADIGVARVPPEVLVRQENGLEIHEYRVGTNGLNYLQVVCDLPELEPQHQQLLQVYSQIVTELGAGERNYLETQALQHAKTGGIGCYSSLRGEIDDPNRFAARFIMSSRSLADNAEAMNEIMAETFLVPKFSERHRVKDLIHQLRVRRDASISNNGHGLAMTAAGAWFRPVPGFNHGTGGLQGILNLRALDDGISEGSKLDELISNLSEICRRLMTQPKHLVTIHGNQSSAGLAESWATNIQQATHFSPELQSVEQCQAFVTTTQVNHCAQVFATVPENHEDAPALAVLAGVLRNGYLHRAIREQGGAYGGGATHDQSNGLFRLYSYRDPNVEETFDAFRGAIDWVGQGALNHDLIEEAILGIVSSIDAPASPAGEAKQHYQQTLFGRSTQHRASYRRSVIETTSEDIRRVAEEYLTRDSAKAVVTHHDQKLDPSFARQVI
jgi:Zn-dependent M16 (insulinase) family peptidase